MGIIIGIVIAFVVVSVVVAIIIGTVTAFLVYHSHRKKMTKIIYRPVAYSIVVDGSATVSI